jgi:hypothetical protein
MEVMGDGDLFHLLLKPDTLLVARFLESGGEDMDIPIPCSCAIPEGHRYQRGRYGDDDQVHLFRQGGHIGIGLDPVDLVDVGVHGIEPSGKAELTHAAVHSREPQIPGFWSRR